MVRRTVLFFLAIGLLLGACSPAIQVTAPNVLGTSAPTLALTPYLSPTSTQSQPIPTFMVSIAVTPSPTATPLLHTLTNDDTMLGLAFRYGVSLEALKTANPSVNPNAMSVGMQLVIPVNAETPQVVPTPTPIPVSVKQLKCYKTGDGGAWCIIGLENNTQTTLENLSAWIGLYDSQAANFSSQVAYAPLDILHPGEEIPILAYFAGLLPEEYSAQAQLLTGSVMAADDVRYIDAEVKIDKLQISADGSQASTNGAIILPKDTSTPTQVWVLVVAYAEDDSIIGARKWKSSGATDFETTVYSLGGVIDHIEVLAEVRP